MKRSTSHGFEHLSPYNHPGAMHHTRLVEAGGKKRSGVSRAVLDRGDSVDSRHCQHSFTRSVKEEWDTQIRGTVDSAPISSALRRSGVSTGHSVRDGSDTMTVETGITP